jgi:hypothetical protein
MTLKAAITPPSGPQVRKLAAWITLAVGLPRVFPIFAQSVSPLRFFEPHVYGIIMIILGVMLFKTRKEPLRSSLFGRIVSALSMTMWVVLAAATMSPTSLLVNASFAVVMLAEIFAIQWGGDANI